MECEKIHFVIDKNHSPFVEQSDKRIQRLFNVKVELNDVFHGAERPMQWICLTGNEKDASHAKDYILALTSPNKTIKLKNIWGHPLLTPRKVDDIERTSCAVLSKCDNNDLEISGTELSIMLAQSMIDDMFLKVGTDTPDLEITEEQDGAEPNAKDQDGKQGSRNDKKSSALLNRNNSSLTTCLSHTSPAPSVSGMHYADSFVTAASQLSSALEANRTLFASGSAISPRTVGSHLSASGTTVPPFHSSHGAPQPNNVFHQVSHKGDGTSLKSTSYFPTIHQKVIEKGHDRHDEVGMEVCEPDLTSRHQNVNHLSLQAQEQQTYLKNLGLSLHYSTEDIDKGLANYSMDDVIRPADFLDTLKRIKGQRHGEGLPSEGPAVKEKTAKLLLAKSKPVSGKSKPATKKKASATTAKTKKPKEVITLDDYSDIDESVICMGSVSRDISAIVISSDEELGENDTFIPVSETGSHRRKKANSQQRPFHIQPQSKLQPQQPTQPPSQPFAQPPPQPPLQQPPQSQHQPLPKPSANGESSGNRDLVNNEEGSSEAAARPTGRTDLRYIVIDGSNVAMEHGNHKIFSVKGLQLCIDYFKQRGHDKITAFVPEWRRYSKNQSSIAGRALLEKLNEEGYVKFTPARRVNGTTIASYDDRYVLNLAEKEDGIVVSNDQFRDLCQERVSYQNIVATRLLQYMFVGNHFMPPDDPLGRHGPHLDEFLRNTEQQARPAHENSNAVPPLSRTATMPAVPATPALYPRFVEDRDMTRSSRKHFRNTGDTNKGQPPRSQAATDELFEKLCQVFPDPKQVPQIRCVLENHFHETDINRLTNYCINAFFT